MYSKARKSWNLFFYLGWKLSVLRIIVKEKNPKPQQGTHMAPPVTFNLFKILPLLLFTCSLYYQPQQKYFRTSGHRTFARLLSLTETIIPHSFSGSQFKSCLEKPYPTASVWVMSACYRYSYTFILFLIFNYSFN